MIITVCLTLTSCESEHNNEHNHNHENENNEMSEHHEHGEGHEEAVHLSSKQFSAMNMKVDTLPFRNLNSYVEANGDLEVPPQNEATVTAIIGANISAINVIEGDLVKKGQVLAYMNHPDLINLQIEYNTIWNELQYLEKEHRRQQKLYSEQVSSGKEFQKIKADYNSTKGQAKGLEIQLSMLGLDANRIVKGEIYEKVPVVSPIDGSVRKVEIKIGQYVQPESELFEIVNVEHIHADLMVYEKDMHKVKEGQKIKFFIESLPSQELEATIYSIGKAFEEDLKAIHLHAEIENKKGLLLPGMYVRGRIMIDNSNNYALPEEGVVREGDKYFFFTAEEEANGEWKFVPVEVNIGTIDDGWIEVRPLIELKQGIKIAWNNAYYLIAEMKKEETEHSH